MTCLGQGQRQGPLRAHAALEGLRVKVTAAHLGDAQVERPDTGLELLGLETVGVIPPLGRALVRARTDVALALDAHRLVDQDRHRIGQSIHAGINDCFQGLVQCGTLYSTAHCGPPFCLDNQKGTR